jgi:hypothetical protein
MTILTSAEKEFLDVFLHEATIITVNAPAATTTDLKASLNPVIAGQSVVFTANVVAVPPGAGTPTGTVTFKDGNVVLGTATISGGTATFSTRFSTPGSHTVTAVYNGDSNFAGSSQSVIEQVNPPASLAPSTTALIAPANPVRMGQTVTFTATVSSTAGKGTPTGTTTHFVGNTAVATMQLDPNGKARFTIRLSAAGKFSIRAVYSGDGTFAGSSQSLIEQVN